MDVDMDTNINIRKHMSKEKHGNMDININKIGNRGKSVFCCC